MRYPTREYQCANRRRTLPLGQAFNLIATRVLDSVVHIIGQGCIVASGAVVTRDCAEHGLYGGIPAKRIKDLPT